MRDILEVLEAIADGEEGFISDGFITVKNPYYQPDNGTNPNLVVHASAILMLLDPR